MDMFPKAKDVIKIFVIVFFFVVLSILVHIYAGFQEKPTSLALFLITFGLIHYNFSSAISLLYNLNPIGPKVSPRFNRIIGFVSIVAGLVLIISIIF